MPVAHAQLDHFEMLNPLDGGDAHYASGDTTAQSVSFELRPHCDSLDYREAFNKRDLPVATATPPGACPPYAVKDPQTKQTPVLKEGDPLDMDVIVNNPSGQSIQRFRAWIAYDPSVIEGELIEIASAFPTPTPGEADFSTTDGYIKLSGSADTPVTGKTIIVARVRLHALPTTQTSIPVTFYDVTGTNGSHTGVFSKTGTQEAAIASTLPGTLLVRMTPKSTDSVTPGGVSSTASAASTGAASSAASDTTAQTSSADAGNSSQNDSGMGTLSSAPSSTAPTGSSVFDLLQVQHLKVTTEGSSVFLAWDVLPSAELVGYNLYYGTISGKYLQKRSVDKNSTTITIRALPEGVTYYFAVRGVNAQNKETDFSQEAGISVGKPETSTAPLTASSTYTPAQTPKTNGNVSGETGVPSTILLFVVLSAVIGTGLAFRRQLSAKV